MSDCQKVRYMTKTFAKQAKKRVAKSHLRTYFCDDCHAWHLGHLSKAVRRGSLSRGEAYGDEAA